MIGVPKIKRKRKGKKRNNWWEIKAWEGKEIIQKHHTIPVHHGGKDSPLVEVTVREHALLHKQIYDETGCKQCYRSYKNLMKMHKAFIRDSKFYSGEYNEVNWLEHYYDNKNEKDILEDYTEFNEDLMGLEDKNIGADVDMESLKTICNLVMGQLKERERDILEKYLGFNDEPAMTLHEIADEYGMGWERTRQIKEKAIRRLRHRSRSRLLRSFLG